MPKRRVASRTASQKAASRRNLEKARKVKAKMVSPPGYGPAGNLTPTKVLASALATNIPHGKIRTLYHVTTPKAADAIVKTRHWKTQNSRHRMLLGENNKVHFVNRQTLPLFDTKKWGSAVVSVRIPAKLGKSKRVRKDAPEEIWVSKFALEGVKVRRAR